MKPSRYILVLEEILVLNVLKTAKMAATLLQFASTP